MEGYAAPEPRSPFSQKVINHLAGVTVSVNYSDFLDQTLFENLHFFEDFVVVTSFDDKKTQQVCNKHSVRCIQTDLFYEKGQIFNKAAGINLGIAHLNFQDWVLHIDSDIVMPDNFRNLLEQADPSVDCIWGADRINLVGFNKWEKHKKSSHRLHRHNYILAPNPIGEIGARIISPKHGYLPCGYFQMWHRNHHKDYPQNYATMERCDILHATQWPRKNRRILPSVFVYHLESEKVPMGTNWSGRQTKKFK